MTNQMTTTYQTERRRQGSATTKRNFTHPRVPTSLINQVDQTILSAQEFGVRKYASRNEFVEAAIRSLLFKENKRRTTA